MAIHIFTREETNASLITILTVCIYIRYADFHIDDD